MYTTECTIGNRPARITDLGRVRNNKSWRSYSLVQVSFTDTGESQTMPAGEFAKWSARLDREAKQRKPVTNSR